MGNVNTFNRILELRRDQRNGAAIDTNTKKEDKAMVNAFVDKLTAYRTELIEDLNNLKAYDDSVEIEKEVAAYREEITRAYAAEKESKIQKFESDIQCITVLIEREGTISEV
jgi:hypothetical protein